jgi:transcriptional regulator with XRE-family HTH domain
LPETGVCPACRAARAVRYGAPLCEGCARAACELAPRPVWLFDSLLLRRSLARVNLPAVPAIVRAASGLSQSDLAAIVGWSRSALGLYERGQRDGVFDTRMLLQFADAVGMPRVALLPLVLGEEDAVPDADSVFGEVGADVDRRGFGGLAAGVAVAAMLPEGLSVPTRVTPSHIKYLRSGIDSLHRRDDAVGGGALLGSALRQWRLARRMLKESSYTEAVGRELLAATGEMAMCAGWLAFDSGNVRLSGRLFEQARLLAAEAGDVMLSAHVLTELSGQASYQAFVNQRSGTAREGLLLACKAADEARYTPLPRLHAWIAHQHANAASLLGDGPAFRAAIARAWRELGHGPRPEDPEWLRIDEADLTLMELRGRANLGDLDAAGNYQETLDLAGMSALGRAWATARLAAILARSGDVTGGVAAGMNVLPALEGGLTSVRTLNELRPVRAALTGGTAGEKEFCERFDAVERTLTAAYG